MSYTIKTTALPVKVERRGRPKSPSIIPDFNPTKVEFFRGTDLKFNDELFNLVKANYARLVDEEIKSLSPIADKWHTSTKAVTFEDFEKLIVGSTNDRQATIKERTSGFEGFDAKALEAELERRPEMDAMKKARADMDDDMGMGKARGLAGV